MKKLSFAMALLASVFLFSCAKDDITVTLREDGHLTVKAVDGNNKPIQGATVSISYRAPSGYIDRFSEGTTDANGYWDAGPLLQGTYYYSISAELNGVMYNDSAPFQIIAGARKNLEVNLFTSVGKVKIYTYTRDYSYRTIPAAGINVLLLPYRKYIENNSLSALINNAEFKQTTGTDGYAYFEDVPSSIDYAVVIYQNNVTYDRQFFNLKKGEETTYEILIF